MYKNKLFLNFLPGPESASDAGALLATAGIGCVAHELQTPTPGQGIHRESGLSSGSSRPESTPGFDIPFARKGVDQSSIVHWPDG